LRPKKRPDPTQTTGCALSLIRNLDTPDKDMNDETLKGSPICEEDIHRFLFSSSAHFVGEMVHPAYHLSVAFPSFQSNHRLASFRPSPTPASFFSLSIRVPVEPPKGNFQIIETYSWMPEQVAVLFTAFYGKLIRSHGHIQKGYNVMVPDIVVPHNEAFANPPFSDAPRKPAGSELNVKNAAELLEAYLFSTPEDGVLPKLLSACTFYHLALENWSTRPILSYTFLVSSVEAILELLKYADVDIFDEQRLKDFESIRTSTPDGAKIVSRIKSSLYSVKKKFVKLVETRLPASFFDERECDEGFCMKPESLKAALQAAYDIRSKYLHTGTTMGFVHLTHFYQNAEIVIGEPVIPDKEIKKLLIRAPSLAGLERIVATLLRSELGSWIKDCQNRSSEEEKIQNGGAHDLNHPTAELQPRVLMQIEEGSPPEEVRRIL
jgi:hypothetical protein